MALSTINLTAGMRANLFSLQQTSKDFEVTQKRLATGLRVNTALDDPINFFAAQEHKLRATDLAGRKDGMSEAIQTIKAANVGVEGINNLIAQAKSLAQSALSATAADATIFASQYATVMTQINRMAAETRILARNLNRQVEPIGTNMNTTLDEIRGLARRLDREAEADAWVAGERDRLARGTTVLAELIRGLATG